MARPAASRNWMVYTTPSAKLLTEAPFIPTHRDPRMRRRGVSHDVLADDVSCGP